MATKTKTQTSLVGTVLSCGATVMAQDGSTVIAYRFGYEVGTHATRCDYVVADIAYEPLTKTPTPTFAVKYDSLSAAVEDYGLRIAVDLSPFEDDSLYLDGCDESDMFVALDSLGEHVPHALEFHVLDCREILPIPWVVAPAMKSANALVRCEG